jgi:hypothetical protein
MQYGAAVTVTRARAAVCRHAGRSFPGIAGRGDERFVLTGPEALLAGVCAAADPAGIEGWPCPVCFEILPAPQDRPSLPPNEAAVYAFTLSAAAGHSARCGPGTVLMGERPARTTGSGSRTRITTGSTPPPLLREACWPTHLVALAESVTSMRLRSASGCSPASTGPISLSRPATRRSGTPRRFTCAARRARCSTAPPPPVQCAHPAAPPALGLCREPGPEQVKPRPLTKTAPGSCRRRWPGGQHPTGQGRDGRAPVRRRRSKPGSPARR